MIKIRHSLAVSFIAIVVIVLLVGQGGMSLWYLIGPWKGSLNDGLKEKIKIAGLYCCKFCCQLYNYV